MRTLKVLVFALVAAALGVVGFAYFGDMRPDVAEISVDIAVPGPAAGNGN